MKFKKIMLITFLLLAILTLGAVSAADDAGALAASDDGEVIDSPVYENDVVALDSENDAVGDGEEKYNVTLDISMPDEDEIYLGDEIYMYASLGWDDESGDWPTGDVVLYVNDDEVAREDVDWPSFYYEFEHFGVYNFKAEYTGDENFNGAVKEFTVNLTNSRYHIGISDDIPYGRSFFNVYAPVLNPGEIEITINGKKFNVDVDEDMDDNTCNSSALNYGLNTVHIYYPGDEVFGEYSADENITVIAYIAYDDQYIAWGESIDFDLTLPSDATGTLAAYYGEYDDEVWALIPTTKIASADLVDGSVNLTLNDLKVGRYNIYVNFTGSLEVVAEWISVFVSPRVTAPHAFLTGEEAYVSFETAKDSVSHIEVVYMDVDADDGYKHLGDADVVDGKAKVSLSGLDKGFYEIEVRYNLTGDEDYLSETRYVYVVDEYNITLNIVSCGDVLIGGNWLYVDYELPGYADGNISYYIDEKEARTSIIEGYGRVISVSDLSIGEHTLEIKFTSSTQGNASDSAKFNVGPAKIYIPNKVDANGMYGSASSIEVNVYENATGAITVLVDNEQYDVASVDAKSDERSYYIFRLTGISLGKHNVSVIYRDDKYPAVSKTKEVSFGYMINIEMDESYGHDNIIRVDVPKDLGNGDLTITVDGKTFPGERDSDIIRVNPSKLSLGKHVVIVNYSGDNFYPAASFNDTFEVYTEIQQPPYKVFAGSEEGITLMLPEDAKGKLNVTVEVYKEVGDEYWTDFEWVAYDSKLVSFVDGKAYYSVAGFPVGEYRFNAKYTGDDYKIGSLDDDSFIVTSVDWGYSYLSFGDNITLRFLSDFADPGQLRVVFSKIVDDTKDWDDPVNVVDTFVLPIENGKVSHTFTRLAVGDYHIFIAEEFVNGTLKGYQGGNSFYVEPPSVYGDSGVFNLGEIPEISIDLPAGVNGTVKVIVYENYTKEVPDIYKEVDTPVKGEVSIDLNDIITDVGQFKVAVKYDGNYGQFSDVAGIYKIKENNKINPNIEVATQNVTVGEFVTVEVTVPKDSSANVIATVGDLGYEGKAVNGKAKILIPNLKVGNHNIIVTFAGDSKYLPQTKTVQVTVFKKMAAITIDCADEIVEGKVLTVEVSVAGATGKVKVNGIEAVLTDGKAIVNISDLPLGENTINAAYEGDDEYEAINITKIVTVNPKGDVGLKASASDINQGQVASISIELDSRATGQVTVNGEKVTVKDGKATFTISDLAVGDYSYLVKFAGDENFAASNKTVSFKVNAYVDPVIDAKDTSALYTAKNKYTVTVYGTDGKLASRVQVIFKVAGKQVGKATTNSNGVATYTVTQIPGSYKITAEALGVNVTKKLTVKHLVTLKTVTLKKSAKKLTLQATLAKVNGKYLKKKTITFKINGKKVATAQTNSKGVAKVTIKNPNVVKNLKVGKKATYTATYLKDTVQKTTKIKK